MRSEALVPDFEVASEAGPTAMLPKKRKTQLMNIRPAEQAPSAELGQLSQAESEQRSKGDLWHALDAWLVAAARARLSGSEAGVTMLFHHFAQLTNSVEAFRRSGRLIAFPSVERLAKELGLGRRTAQRAVRKLEQVGLIEIEWSQGGVGRTNVYRLTTTSNSGEPTAVVGAGTAVKRPPKRRSFHRPNPPSFGRDTKRARKRGAAPGGAGAPPHAQKDGLAWYFRTLDNLPTEGDDVGMTVRFAFDSSRPSPTTTNISTYTTS